MMKPTLLREGRGNGLDIMYVPVTLSGVRKREKQNKNEYIGIIKMEKDYEFRKLVAEMRQMQKCYFKFRTKKQLEECKELERKVDAELRKTYEPELFNQNQEPMI